MLGPPTHQPSLVHPSAHRETPQWLVKVDGHHRVQCYRLFLAALPESLLVTTSSLPVQRGQQPTHSVPLPPGMPGQKSGALQAQPTHSSVRKPTAAPEHPVPNP